MGSIIDNLRHFQIERELTTAELAGVLAVDIDTVAGWFDGDVSPDSMQRYRILKLMENNY